MEPLISVIVPIYEVDQYLGKCIESILSQTYKELEIILVDDGSPDRCPELCELYARKDSRIKVIHKNNGGLVSARKAGIQEASGLYIGYVDGDDWIGPGFYQALYASIAESNADVAVAGFSRDLFSKSQPILNSIPSGIYSGRILQKLYASMISYGMFYQHGITTYAWNKLFKREIILPRQLQVDERISIGEDAALVYPALLDCTKICVTDNCAYHYRQREDSMLKRSAGHQNEFENLKILYDYLTNTISDDRKDLHMKQQIDDFIVGTYIIRSGGVVPSSLERLRNFPLSESIVGKKVLLYGAGTFGQQLMNRIRKDNICDIAGWVDDDYVEYRRCCMDVDSVERVARQDYDYILIANISSEYAKEVKQTLMDYGISEKKIIFLQTTRELRTLALREYIAAS